MIQLCRKDKDMALPNLIDGIILSMKKHGLLEMLSSVLPDKRRDNHHIPFEILLYLAVRNCSEITCDKYAV